LARVRLGVYVMLGVAVAVESKPVPVGGNVDIQSALH
jgi:hypothetical protein